MKNNFSEIPNANPKVSDSNYFFISHLSNLIKKDGKKYRKLIS